MDNNITRLRNQIKRNERRLSMDMDSKKRCRYRINNLKRYRDAGMLNEALIFIFGNCFTAIDEAKIISTIMIENNIPLTDIHSDSLPLAAKLFKKMIDFGVKFELSGKCSAHITSIFYRQKFKEAYKELKEYYREKQRQNHLKTLGPVLLAYNAIGMHGKNSAGLGWNRNTHFNNTNTKTARNIIRKRGLKNNNVTRKNIVQALKRGVRFNENGNPTTGIEESKNND